MDKNIDIKLDYEELERLDKSNEIKKQELENLIYEIVYLLLEEQKLKINNIYLTIQSVSKEEIKNLNKEYRGIDKTTDVLSFPIFEKEELENIACEKNIEKKIKELELGDIFICLDIVSIQSIEYNTGLKRELLYMITHGVCHLLGFDHIQEEEKIVMRALEEKILNKIGVGK